MSEQINAGQIEERETSTSGLLLSVEPLQGMGKLYATDSADAGADEKDTSDDTSADTDGSDESDADGSDTKGADTDLTDALGADTDGTDDSDASIKIDGKDA